MKMWIALSFVTFAALASAKSQALGQNWMFQQDNETHPGQGPQCETMKWANCYGIPCQCHLAVGSATNKTLDCTKLIPKCILMKAEMHRVREGQKTHNTEEKPAQSADEKYDPECESDGKFKAKQCNNSEECWCVNSAGVRRTLKKDKNLKCDKLVKTVLVNLRLTHKPISTELDTSTLKADIANAIHERYKNFSKDSVSNVTYDPVERAIVVNVVMTTQSGDLATMAYYMEKDVKGLTLFRNDQERFEPTVNSQKLQIQDIKVNYIDEDPPDFPPNAAHLYPSITVIVVVVLLVVVIIGVILYLRKRRQRQM